MDACLSALSSSGQRLSASAIDAFFEGVEGSGERSLTIEDLSAFAEQASKARVPSLPPRAWSGDLEAELGAVIALCFDVSQACGQAAEARHAFQALLRMTRRDEGEIRKAVKGSCDDRVLWALRDLRAACPEDISVCLGHRLRPSTWKYLAQQDREEHKNTRNLVISTLISDEQRAAGQNARATSSDFAATRRSQVSDDFDLTVDNPSTYVSEVSRVTRLTTEQVERFDGQASDLTNRLKSMARAHGAAVSQVVFDLLMSLLVLLPKADLNDDGGLEITIEAVESLFDKSQQQQQQQHERILKLVLWTPTLFPGKVKKPVSVSLLAERIWNYMRFRDASFDLLQGNGLLLSQPEGSELKRWVRSTLFDEAKGWSRSDKKICSNLRGRFFKQKNLVLGGKRYIRTSQAAVEFDGLIECTNANAQRLLGFAPQSNAVDATSMPLHMLLYAFDALRLPRLLKADTALLLSNEMEGVEKRDKALQRAEHRVPLKNGKTEEEATLYELFLAGVWKDPAKSAPFDLSKKAVQEQIQQVKEFQAANPQLKAHELKATKDPVDPSVEVDVFEALREGLEFSAFRHLIGQGRLFSRIQLHPLAAGVDDDAPGYGRMLLSRSVLAEQLRPSWITVNFHHRAVHAFQRHRLKVESAAREKGDSGLQHHVHWMPLYHYEKLFMEQTEEVKQLQAKNKPVDLNHPSSWVYKLDEEQFIKFEKAFLAKELPRLSRHPEKRCSSFEPELELKPSETHWCPESRELLDRIAALQKIQVQADHWAFRAADQLLEMIGHDFESYAEAQTDEDFKKAAEISAKAKRRRKNFCGEIAPFLFWKICDEAIEEYLVPYLRQSAVVCFMPPEDPHHLFDAEILQCRLGLSDSELIQLLYERDAEQEEWNEAHENLGLALQTHEKKRRTRWRQNLSKAREALRNKDLLSVALPESTDDMLPLPKALQAELMGELRARLELLDKEFGADGFGQMTEGLYAAFQEGMLVNLPPEKGGSRLFDRHKHLKQEKPLNECIQLRLKAMLLQDSKLHKQKLASIFGISEDKDEEAEEKQEPSLKVKTFDFQQAEVPVPVFHYSKSALLARGWSEEMVRRLVVTHNYQFLEVPSAKTRKTNDPTLVIPARWVWEAEKGWAGKLLGARKRAKKRRKA